MSSVVLVGTRKGAFILTSDEAAPRVAGQRPALWRLGNLPSSPARRGPQPALRLAASRLVRPGDPALRRRRRTWRPVGNEFAYDGVPGHAPVVRRHASIRGSSSASGIWSRRSTDPTLVYAGRRGRRAVPLGRRRQDLAGAARPARTPRAASGSRAPAACACTPSCSTPTNPPHLRRHLGRRRVPHRRRRATWKPINRGLQSNYCPTPKPKWATAYTASPCTRRGPACCSCRSTGT
jgi:hypothetical protein